MKRPAWAACPGFVSAWSGTESMPPLKYLGTQQHMILELLQQAQVIRFSAEQVDALPSISPYLGVSGGLPENHDRDAWDWMREASIPFDITFLDMHGAQTIPGSGLDAEEHIEGCLVVSVKEVENHPEFDPSPAWAGGIFFRPFIGPGGLPLGTVFASDRPGRLATEQVGLPSERDEKDVAARARSIVLRAIAALQLLESVNVELSELPMKPKAREREIKKGRNIALTVRVKQSKRRVSNPSDNRADFSHRFEVRGHYTHHFETKPDGSPNKVFERYANKNPDKVLTIQGLPCVRFWTPPYVKGPIDKPFVPKVRVMETA